MNTNLDKNVNLSIFDALTSIISANLDIIPHTKTLLLG